MGVHADAAPEWLVSSWIRSCQAAGATADSAQLRAAVAALLARWDEPERKYHNITHLVDVLSRVDELAEETHEPNLVRLAAWYHGAIFDASAPAIEAHHAGEDETAGARLATTELTALGLPPQSVARVAELVLALKHHTPTPRDFDCAVLCDADLAMLAVEPQRYKVYVRELREEYSHVPIAEYVASRIAILARLQQREHLYASGMGAAWEEAARQNLEAELCRLRKEQAGLGESATTMDTPTFTH